MTEGPIQSAMLHRWSDLPIETLSPTIGRRLVTGERTMLAHVYLEKGAVVPTHEHDNEQLTYILEGRLRFWLGPNGEQVVDVGEGDVLHIPSGLAHRAEALERTLDLDIFCPPRHDWLDGNDAYLRG